MRAESEQGLAKGIRFYRRNSATNRVGYVWGKSVLRVRRQGGSRAPKTEPEKNLEDSHFFAGVAGEDCGDCECDELNTGKKVLLRL